MLNSKALITRIWITATIHNALSVRWLAAHYRRKSIRELSPADKFMVPWINWLIHINSQRNDISALPAGILRLRQPSLHCLAEYSLDCWWDVKPILQLLDDICSIFRTYKIEPRDLFVWQFLRNNIRQLWCYTESRSELIKCTAFHCLRRQWVPYRRNWILNCVRMIDAYGFCNVLFISSFDGF